MAQIRERMPLRLGVDPQDFYRPNRGVDTDCGVDILPPRERASGRGGCCRQLGAIAISTREETKEFPGDWNGYKQRMQRDFTESRVQELVTTKSFGMGIDKPNIRYTVHYGMAASIEAFYQEAGRAGRNGQEDYALCTVLYSDESWMRRCASWMIQITNGRCRD